MDKDILDFEKNVFGSVCLGELIYNKISDLI